MVAHINSLTFPKAVNAAKLLKTIKSRGVGGTQPAVRDQTIAIFDGANHMTIATVRDDGHPQATTVSYVHYGLTIYFDCGVSSQKASN
jgi:hypothetical protein